MARFPPTDDILVPITMTRLAYAQLLGQKFFPPKVFGRWEGDAAREGTTEWKRRDVGMKIVRYDLVLLVAVLIVHQGCRLRNAFSRYQKSTANDGTKY